MKVITKQTLKAVPSVGALIARIAAIVILGLQKNYGYNAVAVVMFLELVIELIELKK